MKWERKILSSLYLSLSRLISNLLKENKKIGGQPVKSKILLSLNNFFFLKMRIKHPYVFTGFGIIIFIDFFSFLLSIKFQRVIANIPIFFWFSTGDRRRLQLSSTSTSHNIKWNSYYIEREREKLSIKDATLESVLIYLIRAEVDPTR